ncbi:type II secretion system protein [Candidatus Gottesmanbacteria bacterium]|nr:type II secretion system protein [Candidatus Gottesmanbacteria bacterium]
MKKGFTLIELLVVIVIMGILISLGLTSFTSTNRKNRDNRRKGNLRSIATALEAYYNDKGKYPGANASGDITGCGLNDSQACSWDATFTDSKGTVYMPKLPKDPSSTQRYFYSGGNNSYQLYARLENTPDSDIPHDGSGNALSYPNTNCGVNASQLCNYGISSSNTTPENGRSPQ